MRALMLAAVAAAGMAGSAEAATIGQGYYSFRSFPSTTGPIVGRFTFLPDAVDAARRAGEETAIIGYDDLLTFRITNRETKLTFDLDDVLDTFSITVRLATKGTHVRLIGSTSVLAVNGPYSMSFINGLGVLWSGPDGDEILRGYWAGKSAYVPVPAAAPLLGAGVVALAFLRKRPRRAA